MNMAIKSGQQLFVLRNIKALKQNLNLRMNKALKINIFKIC